MWLAHMKINLGDFMRNYVYILDGVQITVMEYVFFASILSACGIGFVKPGAHG